MYHGGVEEICGLRLWHTDRSRGDFVCSEAFFNPAARLWPRLTFSSNVCKPPPLSSIAIFGTGTVGIAAALAAKLTAPACLVLIDHADAKLNLVPEGVVTGTVNSSGLREDEIAEKLKSMTRGLGFDYVIDCVGLAKLVNAGHQALAPRGMVLTIGGPPSAASISMSAQLLGGRTYRGTHQGDSVPETVCIGLLKRCPSFIDIIAIVYSDDDRSLAARYVLAALFRWRR